MKSIIITTILLVFLFAGLAFAQKGVTEMNIDGLTLIYKQAENDVVAVRLFLKGGTANLTPETAGIENFTFQAAVNGGTIKYPKQEYNKWLEKLGSTISASSSNDFSVFGLRCTKDNFNKTWDLFEDVLLNPAFEENEVELTREQIKSAIKTEDTNPDALIRKEMVKWYFDGHYYSNRQIGTTSNIESFTVDQLKNHYKNLMQKSRILLVIVGKLDKKDLEKRVKNLANKIPSGNYQETKFPVPEKSKLTDYRIIEKALPTNYIMGQYLLPGMEQPDYYVAQLAHSILRDRVFEEVRTKRNLSYAPAAAIVTENTSTGFIYVSTTDPDSAIKVMLGELQKLKDVMIPEKEMKNHKMRFFTMDFMRQETNATQAGMLAAAQLYTGTWKNAEKLVDNINKVTPEDIKLMANKYITNLNFLYIGKKNKVDETLLNWK